MGNNTLELKQQKAALVQQAQGILASGTLTDEQRSQVNDLTTRAEAINETLNLNERTARLAGEQVQVHDNSLDKPFANLGDQLQMIQKAALNPHAVDPRLFELNQRAAAGASIAVPADGGFLVHPTFSSEILKIAHDTGMIFNRTRKIPLDAGSTSIKIHGVDESSRVNGSRWGGIQMYWGNEADAMTASKPKFRQVEMETKALTGLMYATDKLLSNATALGSVVSAGFGEELAFKMDDAVFNGDGVTKPLGFMQCPALVTVTKEASQTAATVTWENIKKMFYRLHSRSRRNAVWFVNQEVEAQLMGLAQVVASGGSSVVQGVGPAGVSMYTPPGFGGSEFGTLMGRPVVPVEQASALGTVGDIVLFDPTQWAYIDQGAMQQASSIHVRFLTNETAFRWVYYVDGQPTWHKALTPYKGSSTQSPYITLETRA